MVTSTRKDDVNESETKKKNINSDNNSDGFISSESILKDVSEDFIASWTEFLCQGSVTGGLFQAVPVAGANSDTTSGSCSLKLRGIPFLSILTFGPIQPPLLSQKTNATNGNSASWIWRIPIQSGWLSLAGSKGDRGCLAFQLDVDESNVDKPFRVCRLESRIENYRPWFGGTPPIPKIRRALYLGIQSRLHAYITWRFHREWHRRLHEKLSTVKTKSI